MSEQIEEQPRPTITYDLVYRLVFERGLQLPIHYPDGSPLKFEDDELKQLVEKMLPMARELADMLVELRKACRAKGVLRAATAEELIDNIMYAVQGDLING